MNPLPIPRPLTVAALLATLCLTALGADDNGSTIKFSNPGKPGTLKLNVVRGDVRIQGGASDVITIKSDLQSQHQPRKDGLRVLTESATYTLTEKDNVVTLDAATDGWAGASSDFDITVPRNTNIVIGNSLGGDIMCRSVGDVEIKSLHGEVTLDDVGGGAVVETLNGEIRATLRELHEGKAFSFTSMNGEVILKVPAATKANVRLRTQNGKILTDFDDKALVTKVESLAKHRGHMLTPEVREAFREAARAAAVAGQHAAAAIKEAADATREGVESELGEIGEKSKVERLARPTPPVPPMPPTLPAIPPMTGGKMVTGALNGGGPEINVATMNGDVKLLRFETAEKP